MTRKIFVTGANGFIGGRLVSKLVKRRYEVTCLVRDPAKAEALKTEGATLIKGDITNKESMRDGMAGAEAVFHVAGWYAIGAHDDARMHAVNIEGARNTLELAAELGVSKILYTSTVGVFGNTHGEVVDEAYRVPKEEMGSMYELTKWLAHYEVAEPLQQKGAPLIILQPGGVTGAGDESPHILAFQMFLQKIPVMMGARSGLTLAHVEDIAEGHILAFEKGRAGESYILAGQVLNYQQVFELCEKITGIRATKLWAPGWVAGLSAELVGMLEKIGWRSPYSSEALAVMDDYTFWAKADKARRELGWNPRPTEETLRDVLTYLQRRQ